MVADTAEYRGGHPLVHPPDYALTFAEGAVLPVPKSERGNLEWREEIMAAAEDDPQMQAHLRALCASPTVEGCLLFINLFVFTFEQQAILEGGQRISVTGAATNTPFVTWPVQDAAVRQLLHAIDHGHDLVMDKSRQMGATWLIIVVFVWYLLFRPNSVFIVMSSTEELVDNADDPFSVFWKIDYIRQRLPDWLHPRLNRTHMKLTCSAIGSSIHGRSTTSTKGRGGSATACLIDEASDIRFLEAVWTSFGQSCPCRIVNSTPKGPTYYYTLVASPQIPKLALHWSDHPIKGRGRCMMTDKSTGERYISSPWYEKECEKAGGRKTRQIAQELDMDHLAAGSVFFDLVHLARQEVAHVRPPLYVGDIAYEGGPDEDMAIWRRDHSRTTFKDRGFGPWKLWCELRKDAYGRMRPRQDRTYVFGIDISHGLGHTQSSNSVMWVIERETGEQAAIFASPSVEPAELARLAARAGYWFGGTKGMAFLGWENNGPGQTFTKHIRRLKYGWVLKPFKETKGNAEQQETWGWNNNTTVIQDFLGELRSGFNRDQVICRDADTIKEMRTYIFWGDTGIGPGWLEADADGSKQTHGDRVIAAGVARYGLLWVPRAEPVTLEPPKGSPAARWKEYEEEEAKAARVY